MLLNNGQAIREALKKELESNIPTVFLGQDLQYNLYGYTEGLVDLFGEERVINTPISEASIVGLAIGAAKCGIRTVVDLTVANFLLVAMDQIVNMASKTAYMYNGQFELPLTIMCGEFYNCGNAAQHSDRLHSLFINFPGLKIVTPTTPQDSYSLLRAAISDKNPVMYFSDRTLFYSQDDIDLDLKVTIGSASILKEGTDVTIIAVSGAVKIATDLLSELEVLKISTEIIDVRSIVPFDKKTIFSSISKTGRVIIADTSNKSGSFACNLSSIIAEEIFHFLKAPIGIVSYEDVPVPFANNLELEIMPTKEKLLRKVIDVYNYGK